MPTIINNAEDDKPCAICNNKEPVKAIKSFTKSAAKRKFIWAIDEYAIIRLRSV
jgi:hypothetical protein